MFLCGLIRFSRYSPTHVYKIKLIHQVFPSKLPREHTLSFKPSFLLSLLIDLLPGRKEPLSFKFSASSHLTMPRHSTPRFRRAVSDPLPCPQTPSTKPSVSYRFYGLASPEEHPSGHTHPSPRRSISAPCRTKEPLFLPDESPPIGPEIRRAPRFSLTAEQIAAVKEPIELCKTSRTPKAGIPPIFPRSPPPQRRIVSGDKRYGQLGALCSSPRKVFKAPSERSSVPQENAKPKPSIGLGTPPRTPPRRANYELPCISPGGGVFATPHKRREW